MSVAAKVMGQVLIRRISGSVDAKLRKKQVGFRKGRSTIEQIFVLRNIVEQQGNGIPACMYVLSTTKRLLIAFTRKPCGRSWRVMRYRDL